MSVNLVIMTEKGRLATQFQLLPTINYSFCDYICIIMISILNNGRDSMTLTLSQKYKCKKICDLLWRNRE